MRLTVDASVFVSADRANEQTHAHSFEFVARIDREELQIVCPSIVLTEAATAIGRITGDEQAALNLLSDIENIPGLELVPITVEFARRAAVIGAALRMRGADSIYVQCALSARAALVTWDNEMLTRSVMKN